jgi:hypothetical protein
MAVLAMLNASFKIRNAMLGRSEEEAVREARELFETIEGLTKGEMEWWIPCSTLWGRRGR